MSLRRSDVTVASLRREAEGVFEIGLQAPDLAREIQPGQFVEVGWPSCETPFLFRPMSYFRKGDEGISILFRVVGIGTAKLARTAPGQRLSVIGPLGRPFPRRYRSPMVTFVGGGVGIPPLWDAARAHAAGGGEARVLIGARSGDDVLGLAAFREIGILPEVATDDGSLGQKGPVTALLGEGDRSVLACGPVPMLKAVQAWAGPGDREAYLALEAPMACGFGACLGCTVALRDPDPEKGAYGRYARVCTDGPVFRAEEVVL